ncbi:GNAT family acetyltransferase [Fontibacillus phaseoli]|uniref:GNAT family acetyltransferase n=1 Tax=Fontibacillus phaseoli TaxID=1416533 RepID=A0A369BIP3_9BACL|nr:GNAT family N-acetyltransferase [Fontibacillus phaseoli]RCX21462.1 GNAT family acetyltransferase [Fontibacillus phaseoli]
MRQNIIIREFVKDDCHQISTIISDNLIHVNSRDYGDKIINNMLSIFTPEYIMGLSKTRKMFVAVIEDIVVGTASLDRDTIYMVFVDKDRHKSGIGRELIRHIERMALDSGVATLQLPSSLTAQSFYKKLGYLDMDVVESEQYGRDIIMIKKLDRRDADLEVSNGLEDL